MKPVKRYYKVGGAGGGDDSDGGDSYDSPGVFWWGTEILLRSANTER